jgi:hypothetical protein
VVTTTAAGRPCSARRVRLTAQPRRVVTGPHISPSSEYAPLLRHTHLFGDPGSPSDVAGERSVDARNTVDMNGNSEALVYQESRADREFCRSLTVASVFRISR